MSIHQQATIPAGPRRVCQVLADAEALSALSGKSGRAARTEGEEFAAFDGNVTGRQIELPAIWQGRDRAAAFLAEVAFRLVPRARFTRTRANGQPALAVCMHDAADGLWRAGGLLVLTLNGEQVTGLTRFESAAMRPFGLPGILPDDQSDD